MTTKERLPRTRTGTVKGLTGVIIDAWVERLATPLKQLDALGQRADSQLKSSLSMRNDKLYHYGHWTIGEGIRDARGRTKLVLINGDRYNGAGGFGPSTQSRTNSAERAARATGIPTLTVPFSALSAAGIEHDSIRPLEILNERYTQHIVTMDQERFTNRCYGKVQEADGSWSVRDESRGGYQSPFTLPVEEIKHSSGQVEYRVPTFRHWLGEAVFSARVYEYVKRDCTPEEIAHDDYTGYRYVGSARIKVKQTQRMRTAKFLSAFDHNEARECYFLCELPRTSAATVDDAFEALKPPEVVGALGAGLDVLRQGDIFAIPTSLTTRELKSRGKLLVKAHPLLTTNHVATAQISTNDGDLYARGILTHQPSFREPDHARVKLGDGKTWYRIVKNTVPTAKTRSGSALARQSGSSRAWTLGGQVD